MRGDLECKSGILHCSIPFASHAIVPTKTKYLWLRRYRSATERMSVYKPAEHEGTTSVAPLLQFFELVHIGDTIQSMVQVFFDKEIVRSCAAVGRSVYVY